MTFSPKNPLLLLGCLVFGAILFRLLTYGEPAFSNFAPVVGMAVCAGWLSGSLALRLIFALGGLFLGDALINLRYGLETPDASWWALSFGPSALLRYAMCAGLFALGSCSKNLRLIWLPGLTILGCLVFYLVGNSISWASSSAPFAYPKTIAGWWQAQTVGLPGFPPSYIFLRNALIGNMVFTFAFMMLARPLPRKTAALALRADRH